MVHVGPTTWRGVLVETGQVAERRISARHREERDRRMAHTPHPHWPRGGLAASSWFAPARRARLANDLPNAEAGNVAWPQVRAGA